MYGKDIRNLLRDKVNNINDIQMSGTFVRDVKSNQDFCTRDCR